MNKGSRFLAAILAALLLTLLFALPAATAGGGTDVWVNNVWLNSTSPYWKNGNAPASASDWNAYYNDATNTLTLHNAQITDPHLFPGAALIYADGDLNLVLSGTNTISRTETVTSLLFGVFADGSLTVSGDGSLNMQLSSSVFSSRVYGIYARETVTVLSGLLSVSLEGNAVYGMAALLGMLLAGGETVMDVNGTQVGSLLFIENGGFRMVGGKFTGTAVSDEQAAGLLAIGIVLAGGEGVFRAQSASFAVGLFGADPVLYVSGGHFIFAGDTCALVDFLTPGQLLDLRLTNVQTYGSDAVNGAGKRLWTSDADGRLVAIVGSISPFLYAEFLGGSAAVTAPQTGDNSLPWLWAGVALCAAAGVVAWVWRMRGRAV